MYFEVTKKAICRKEWELFNLTDLRGKMMRVLENSKKIVFKGEVIHGRQIGRTIGFPTANLRVDSENESSLQKGVYGVKILYKGASYRGVGNIGFRPTFKEEEKPTLSFEVYIFDFNQVIYGEQLIVEILFLIRHEHAFESVDQLIAQLEQDIEKANRQFLLVNR